MRRPRAAAQLALSWATLVLCSCTRGTPDGASNHSPIKPAASSSATSQRPRGERHRGAPAGTGDADLASPAASAVRDAAEEFTWTFERTPLGRIDVVVVLPDRSPGERFPLLIALHGRGEAMKGPARGARGWVDDYQLMRAIRRLSYPPLKQADFEGFVEEPRLARVNAELTKQPYRGMVVLCAYTPDVLTGERPFERARPYARFLSDTVLPRARKELPILPEASATGIDGVSLGGRVALLSGLYHPRSFGAVAGLQAAFDSADAPRLKDMALSAMRDNPSLRLRLLTSSGDYFVEANRAISRTWQQFGVPHQFLLVPGPHDYIFNRGPGALEMLLFHDRALRGEPTLD